MTDSLCEDRDARLSYEAHMEQMVVFYPQIAVIPWSELDEIVVDAWRKQVLPDPDCVSCGSWLVKKGNDLCAVCARWLEPGATGV